MGKNRGVAGVAIITEACIDVKDRACVDVCPVQCIYEFDPAKNQLFSEDEAGSGEIENTHTPRPDSIAIFGDSILYVNTEECTSCTACYQPDVCPVGAIYSEEDVPGRQARRRTTTRGSEQGPRPHVLHPAQSRRLRRLTALPRPAGSEGLGWEADRVSDVTIGLIGAGAMGAEIGRALVDAGRRVVSVLDGRSRGVAAARTTAPASSLSRTSSSSWA